MSFDDSEREPGEREANRVGGAADVDTNRVGRLQVPLEMAKAKVGACVRQAIGERQMKEFGDKGTMGNICSGERAPEYLARIYMDPAARRRFAQKWLEGDAAVRMKTTTCIEWDETEKAG